MPLTETQIRNLKPESTPKKHFDGEGLFLGSTSKTGAKDFRVAIPMRFSPAYPQRTRTRKR